MGWSMGMISSIRKFFRRKPLVVVIRLDGVIGAVSRFGSGGLDDSNTQKLLEKAFEFEKAKAIAIKINSPGGSPTQSSLIASRILKLSEEKKNTCFMLLWRCCSVWRLLVSLCWWRNLLRYKFDYWFHRCNLCKFWFFRAYIQIWYREKSIHGWRRKKYARSFPARKS